MRRRMEAPVLISGTLGSLDKRRMSRSGGRAVSQSGRGTETARILDEPGREMSHESMDVVHYLTQSD